MNTAGIKRYSLFLSGLLSATSAFAQTGDATPPHGDAGEIIVTAQKRSERLGDVPLAISAVSSEDIKTRGVASTEDLTKIVPSFNVQKSGFGQPVFYIRGIGFSDTTVSISPTVSVYSDEVPLSYAAMARGAVLDLERVEVLKGPQGTLFGQNSTGGAVNYIAAKPTSSPAAGIDLGVGRFDAVRASAFVSGPITDTLSARIAVEKSYSEGWQRSITRPQDTRGGEDFQNGRLTVNWEPSDSVRIALVASGWRDRSDTQAPQFALYTPASVPGRPNYNAAVGAAMAAQQPGPDDSRLTDWDPGSRIARNDSFYQTSLRGDVDLSDAVTLTSISAYSRLKVDTPVDVDGTTFTNGYFITKAKLKTWSQELRLAGSAGPLQWLVGGNYQRSETNESVEEFINATNNAPLFYNHVVPIDNQRVDAYAVFGSADWKLTNTVTARASGRYTKENRDFQGCLADGGDGRLAAAAPTFNTLVRTGLGLGPSPVPVVVAPGGCVTTNAATGLIDPIISKALDEDNFSWRVGLDWKATPGILLYANVSKGYKSGGFTATPAITSAQLNPVTQESVLAYELGLKGDILDRAVNFNLAAFYYDYRNKQLQGYLDVAIFGALPTLVNVEKSSVTGAEFDVTIRPVDNLRFQIGGSYLDTKAKSTPALSVGPLGTPYDFSGEAFPYTPKYQATIDGEYRIPISGTAEAYVGASARYRSSASAAFGRTQNAQSRSIFTIDAYTLLDVRAGVSFNEGSLVAEIWGRNITDKFYLTGVTRTVDAVQRYTGTPATWGARLSWRL